MNKTLIPRPLAKAGFPLQAAGDGFQAVQAMASWPFDAVLMDCQMPEIDGLEAMEADGEPCLASGVDAMLDRWIPRPIETARSS